MLTSVRDIRLLHLLPGHSDDPIKCTVRVVSLDQYPKYEALSYVWGDRIKEKAIDISGNSVSITENLYDGLWRLRLHAEERILWVDQLCINQWDVKEKAAQVALMRDIYKQCTRCTTWMGELEGKSYSISSADAEIVFEFLRQVAAMRTTPLHELPVLFQYTDRGQAARRAFEAFSMYGNTWWSRVWTVQEAVIPAHGELKWGPLSIQRQQVVDAARNLRDLHEVSSLPRDFASRRVEYTELLRRLLYPVHGFSHAKHDGVLNLLMRWRHREATDPRDKVYALTGLIPSNTIPSAQSCDYTVAVPKLFAMVTLDLIQYERGLRPLVAACELPQVTPGIPTWAIDFASCNRIGKRQLRWWGHSHRYEEFRANRGHCTKSIDSTDDSRVLQLSGVYIDEVLETRELLRVEASEDINPDHLRDLIHACSSLIQQYRAAHPDQPTYRDGFTWASSLVRTLLGDVVMDELPLSRLSAYGRTQLQREIETLFNELGVQAQHLPLDCDCDYDFAPRITAAEERVRAQQRKQTKRTRLSSEYIARRAPSMPPGLQTHTLPPNSSSLPLSPLSPLSPSLPLSSSPSLPPPPSQVDGPHAASELFEALVGMLENQTFFVTKTGYMGIGPARTRGGDQVWVFRGGRVPFVMRRRGRVGAEEEEKCGGPQLELVGDAYVHGVMDGEGMDGGRCVQNVCIY